MYMYLIIAIIMHEIYKFGKFEIKMWHHQFRISRSLAYVPHPPNKSLYIRPCSEEWFLSQWPHLGIKKKRSSEQGLTVQSGLLVFSLVMAP